MTIDTANQVWAAVVARSDQNIADLDQVYASTWLAEVRASVVSMRARGQYRIARQIAPITIYSALQLPNGQIEAYDAEEWDDRLYDSSGALAQTYPSHVEQHYVMQNIDARWRIVRSELIRS